MSTTIWKGSINFGLVSIPVKISAAARDERISLNQIVMVDGVPHPVGVKDYDKTTGEIVNKADIEKGYMVGDGQYVIFSKEDWKSFDLKSSKIITVEEFVAAHEIDAVYFDKSYHVIPEEAGIAAYSVLTAAMNKGNRKAGKNLVGIAKWTHSGRENTVALRLVGNRIMMHTIFFKNEVRDVPVIETKETDDKIVEVAGKLLEAMTMPFDPARYHDTYRNNLQAVIDQRIAAKQFSIGPASAPGTQIPDIMATLKASIAAAKAATPEADAEPAPTKPKRGSKTKVASA